MHYLFHLGPDPLADPPCVLVALDPALRMTEWRGDDPARLFRAAEAELGGDWRAFAPLARALNLPPGRLADPTEDQAIAMAGRALQHADLGKYWQVADPVTRYAILQCFGLLARSGHFAEAGRGWPYRCRFEGTLNGDVFAIASSDAAARSVTMVDTEPEVRQAFEAVLDPGAVAMPDASTLLLEDRTPWWLDFTEALFGIAFEPMVLNVAGGKVHHFEDQTGILLAAIAAALSVAAPGGEGSTHLAVGAHDLRCTLTRFDP